MTIKEAIERLDNMDNVYNQLFDEDKEALDVARESIRNIEEIEEVINCDADAETKCRMISNILTAPPHYFKEPKSEYNKTGYWVFDNSRK